MAFEDLISGSIKSTGGSGGQFSDLFDVAKSVPTQAPVQQMQKEDKGFAWNPFEGVGDFVEGVKDLAQGAWDFGGKMIHQATDWGEGLLTNKIEDRGINDVTKFDKYMEDINLSRNPEIVQQTWQKMYDEGVVAEDFASRAENKPAEKELDIDKAAAEEAKKTFRKELEDSVKDIYESGDRMKMKYLNAGIEEYVAQYGDAYNNISMSYNNQAFNKDEWFKKLNTDFKENLKSTYKEWAQHINAGDDDADALNKIEAKNPQILENISQFGEDLFWQSNNASREHFMEGAGLFNVKQLWNTLQAAGTLVSGATAYVGEGMEAAKHHMGLGYDVSEELGNLDVYRDQAGLMERYLGKGKYWLGELLDGAPTIVPMMGTIIAGDKGLSKIPAIANIATRGKTANIVWDMAKDTMLYDHIAQVSMGRGNNEQDALENFMFNLPINSTLGLFHKPISQADVDFDRFFASTKDYTKAGTIDKDALDYIKKGDMTGAAVREASSQAGSLKGDNRIALNTLDDETLSLASQVHNELNTALEAKKNKSATAEHELIFEQAGVASKQGDKTDWSSIDELIKSKKTEIDRAKKADAIPGSTEINNKENVLTLRKALDQGHMTPDDFLAQLNAAAKEDADFVRDQKLKKNPQFDSAESNIFADIETARNIIQQQYIGDPSKIIIEPVTHKVKQYADKILARMNRNLMLSKDIGIDEEIGRFIFKGNNQYFDRLTGNILAKQDIIDKLTDQIGIPSSQNIVSNLKRIKDKFSQDKGYIVNYMADLGMGKFLKEGHPAYRLASTINKVLNTYDPSIAFINFEKNINEGFSSMSDKEFRFFQANLLNGLVTELSKKGKLTEKAIRESDLFNLWKFNKETNKWILDSGNMNAQKLSKKLKQMVGIFSFDELAKEGYELGKYKRLSAEILQKGKDAAMAAAAEQASSETVKSILKEQINIGKNIAEQTTAVKAVEDLATDVGFNKSITDSPENVQYEKAKEIIDDTIKKNAGGFLMGKDLKADIEDMKQMISVEDTLESKLRATDTIMRYVYGLDDKAFIDTVQDIVQRQASLLGERLATLDKDKLFELVDAAINKIKNIEHGDVGIWRSSANYLKGFSEAATKKGKNIESILNLKALIRSKEKVINSLVKAKDEILGKGYEELAQAERSKIFNSLDATQKKKLLDINKSLGDLPKWIEGHKDAIDVLEKENETLKKTITTFEDIDNLKEAFIKEINDIKFSDINADDKYNQILLTKYNNANHLYKLILDSTDIDKKAVQDFFRYIQASKELAFIKSSGTTLDQFIKESDYKAISIKTSEIEDMLKKAPSSERIINVGGENIKIKELPHDLGDKKKYVFDSKKFNLPTYLTSEQMIKDSFFDRAVGSKYYIIVSDTTPQQVMNEGKGITEVSLNSKNIIPITFSEFLKKGNDSSSTYFIGQEFFKRNIKQGLGGISVITTGEPEDIVKAFLNKKNIFVQDVDLIQYTDTMFAVRPGKESTTRKFFKDVLQSADTDVKYSEKGVEEMFNQEALKIKSAGKDGDVEKMKYYQRKGFSEYSTDGMEKGKNALFLSKYLEGAHSFVTTDKEVEAVFKEYGYTGKELISIEDAIDTIGANMGTLGSLFRETFKAIYRTAPYKTTNIDIKQLISTDNILKEYTDYIESMPSKLGIYFEGAPVYKHFKDIFESTDVNVRGLYAESFEKLYHKLVLGGMPIEKIRPAFLGIMRKEGFDIWDTIREMTPSIANKLFPSIDVFRIQTAFDRMIGILQPSKGGKDDEIKKFNEALTKFFEHQNKIKPDSDEFIIVFLEGLQRNGLLSKEVDIYKSVDSLGELRNSLSYSLEALTNSSRIEKILDGNIVYGITSTVKNVVDTLESSLKTESKSEFNGLADAISKNVKVLGNGVEYTIKSSDASHGIQLKRLSDIINERPALMGGLISFSSKVTKGGITISITSKDLKIIDKLKSDESYVRNMVSQYNPFKTDTVMDVGEGLSRDTGLSIKDTEGELAGLYDEGFSLSEGRSIDYNNLLLDFVGNMKSYTKDMASNFHLKGDYGIANPNAKTIFIDPVNYKLIGTALDTPKWNSLMGSKGLKDFGTLGWIGDVKGFVNSDKSGTNAFDELDLLAIGNLGIAHGYNIKETVESVLNQFNMSFMFKDKAGQSMKPKSMKEAHSVISNILDSIDTFYKGLSEKAKGRYIKEDKKFKELFKMEFQGRITKEYDLANIVTNPLWKAYMGEYWNRPWLSQLELLKDRFIGTMHALAEKGKNPDAYLWMLGMTKKIDSIMEKVLDVHNLKDSGIYRGIDDVYTSKAFILKNELLNFSKRFRMPFRYLKNDKGVVDKRILKGIYLGRKEIKVDIKTGNVLQYDIALRGIDDIFPNGIHWGDYYIDSKEINDVEIIKYRPIFQHKETGEIHLPPSWLEPADVVDYLETQGMGWEEIMPGLSTIKEGKGMPNQDMQLRIFFEKDIGYGLEPLSALIDTKNNQVLIEQRLKDTGKVGSVNDLGSMLPPDTAKEFNDGFPSASCQI